jgi:hypothetical protein
MKNNKEIKEKIIHFLGGLTFEEIAKIRQINIENVDKTIKILLDWRRGMPMECKDVDTIEKIDNQMRKIVRDLPINCIF